MDGTSLSWWEAGSECKCSNAAPVLSRLCFLKQPTVAPGLFKQRILELRPRVLPAWSCVSEAHSRNPKLQRIKFLFDLSVPN